MSKEIDNIEEKYKVNIILFMVSTGITIILLVINTYFFNAIGTVGRDILMLIISLLSIVNIVISYRLFKASRIIKNNKNIQNKLHDERAKEIIYESQACGFIMVIISTGVYGFFAVVLKIIFYNSYLYNLSGFIVSSIIMALGIIAFAICQYRIDNK